MSAGERRDLIRIITPPTIDDGSGGQTDADREPTFVTAFAAIHPLTSREQANAAAVQFVGTHIIELAYRPDVDTTQIIEVVADGDRFEIVGIVDVDRKRRVLELTCIEAK